MFDPRFFSFATKSLRSRKVRSWITIFGIVISIAVILILITLSSGLQYAVEGIFSDFGKNRIIVMGPDGNPRGIQSVTLTDDDQQRLERLSVVKMVVPRYLASATKVEYQSEEAYMTVAGLPNVDVDQLVKEYKFDRDIVTGRYFNENERYVAVIGAGVADTTKDDRVFTRQVELRNSLQIAGETFKIVGIYKKTGTDQDNMVIIPFEDAQHIFNATNTISAMDVVLKDNVDMEDAKFRVEKLLNTTRGKDTFTMITPDGILKQFNQIIAIVQGILVALASISMFVGAIGIANTMFTAVLEREKEIGIMKSIGATNFDIMEMFLIESGLIGLIGGIVGVIMGILVSYAIGAIAAAAGFALLDIRISLIAVTMCLTFSFIVGMASGAIPSYIASRKKIVDTLREN